MPAFAIRFGAAMLALDLLPFSSTTTRTSTPRLFAFKSARTTTGDVNEYAASLMLRSEEFMTLTTSASLLVSSESTLSIIGFVDALPAIKRKYSATDPQGLNSCLWQLRRTLPIRELQIEKAFRRDTGENEEDGVSFIRDVFCNRLILRANTNCLSIA